MDKTSRFTGQSCIYVAFLASKCFPCPVNTCGLFSSTRSCKVLFLLLLCCCLRHCAALLSSFALDRLSLCLLLSVLHCHCRFRERSQLSNGLLCSVNLAPRAVYNIHPTCLYNGQRSLCYVLDLWSCFGCSASASTPRPSRG